jgi:UDP-GlcNAc3NAcA epimerase
MLMLMANSRKILTDSGGIQKETYMLGVPCVTRRENTEWMETLEGGWNVLVGAEKGRIIKVVRDICPAVLRKDLFGGARASGKILEIMVNII